MRSRQIAALGPFVLALLSADLPSQVRLTADTTYQAQRAGQVPRPGSGQAARREASVPFKVGETLTYEVSWSSVVVAGLATATVVEKKPSFNSTAYYIVVEGRPVPLLQKIYNLYYKMDTLVDSFTALSHRGALYSEEGSDHRLGSTTFDRNARRAHYELQTDKVEKSDFPIPAGTQDGLAALFIVRGRAFKAGEAFTLPVADSGAMYTVPIQVGAPEQIKVPAGDFTAWPLKAEILDAQNQAIWKNIAVWISTDPRRLPVRLQAELPVGNFVLALREAR
jgi:hypothetical protein